MGDIKGAAAAIMPKQESIVGQEYSGWAYRDDGKYVALNYLVLHYELDGSGSRAEAAGIGVNCYSDNTIMF